MNATIGTDHATFRAEPAHGRPVTFEVRYRTIDVSTGWGRNMQDRYVVGLLGSDGDGFSHHTTFETACARALTRARRFEAAYSKPRPVARRHRLELVGGTR